MNEQELERKSKDLLVKAASGIPEASPFLKTRVLAGVRERRESRRRVRRWKVLAAVSTAAAAGLLAAMAVMLVRPGADFEAVSGQPYAVRVELEKGEGTGVQLARIRLPEGVEFYSAAFPQLRARRSLVVEWDPSAGDKLPIVVAGRESGVKTIEIEFLNAKEERIGSREVRIRFEERRG